MLPDYHGNRSPLSDPTLHGMVCGLTLGDTKQNLAITYLATLQALAYNTRYIIESMTEKGHVFDSIFICGGFANNKLYMQCHADITGMMLNKFLIN
jgi:ribulose kinase